VDFLFISATNGKHHPVRTMTKTHDIDATLQNTFGLQAFRPGQREIIRPLLAGRSALAVFPTGAGKSLCYQLTALHLDGLTLVISPLIALMKDQVDDLTRRGIAAAKLDSTLESEEWFELLRKLRSGKIKLLYISPERLSNERFVNVLRQIKVSLLVVDEAHCISEWGHNFRPDYLRIAHLSRALEFPCTLALTATATPRVAEDICREFAVPPDAFVQTGFHRPNLTMEITPCLEGERTEKLIERLRSRPPGPTIVYVTLQRTAEQVASELEVQGFRARAYHAGLGKDSRSALQDGFMRGDYPIMVATIAFGMGIDKADIRYIYHFNLPKGLENYAQEIGRAGRDGRPAICELLACGADRIVLENFAYGNTPDPISIDALVSRLVSQKEVFDVSVFHLSVEYDMKPIVVETLLTYLELDGFLRPESKFFSEYQISPRRDIREIFASFDDARAGFLRNVFADAAKGRTWYRLDVAETARRLNEPRERILKALSFLEERGDLTLKSLGMRQQFRSLRAPGNLSTLQRTMRERFAEREAMEIRRIDQVFQLVDHTGCRTRHLLDYFGEKLEQDCGHCDRCQGRAGAKVKAPRRGELGPREREIIREVRSEGLEVLQAPRALARFLCGLHSPKTTQARLGGHRRFAALATWPFAAVLAACGDAKAVDFKHSPRPRAVSAIRSKTARKSPVIA
jgi:ATP-dependent DNA helicase RecQ